MEKAKSPGQQFHRLFWRIVVVASVKRSARFFATSFIVVFPLSLAKVRPNFCTMTRCSFSGFVRRSSRHSGTSISECLSTCHLASQRNNISSSSISATLSSLSSSSASSSCCSLSASFSLDTPVFPSSCRTSR